MTKKDIADSNPCEKQKRRHVSSEVAAVGTVTGRAACKETVGGPNRFRGAVGGEVCWARETHQQGHGWRGLIDYPERGSITKDFLHWTWEKN